MGKFKKILSTFVILISIFALSTIKVNAATGTISISSNKSQVVVGNTVTFTVTVKSSVNMAALQYNISYDSSMLSLTSGNSSDAPVFGNNVKSKTYTFKFKAKKSGTASFKFNAVGAAMDKDEEIKFTSKSKSIKIITQAQLEASYSSNNKLSKLAVEGYTLSPNFSSTVTSYTVNLPANTETIKITGTKADSKASVEGLGNITVEDGTNTIKVVVTAENGSTKTYTITAIVEELNPVYVTIDNQEYTVIRKAKLLANPSSNFIDSTTTINENNVPSLFNEKANLTLVGLKDQEGNIELYIYNQNNNTYTKYNQHSFSELTLYIEDKEIENYTEKNEIIIDEKTISVYTIENDPYQYFYAINLATGTESIYRYDQTENTVQKYIEPEKIIVEEKVEEEPILEEKTYHYIIIGLLGFIFLTYFIILINLIFKGNKNTKKKNNNKEVNITPIITEKTTTEEELSIEEKEIHEEIERIGTQEIKLNDIQKDEKIEEKEKLLKETEEELTRIKNSSPTETNELEEIVNEVVKEKKTKKGTKSKTKKTKKNTDL